MKVLQSSIFRAVCAVVVGALLVKYREQTVTWITIVIGAIFFVSGLISCIAYFSAKRKSSDSDVDIYDAQGNLIVQSKPVFPIVGLGSLILGAILALLPNLFVNGLVYVLAAILILGAVNQFFNLTVATRFAHVGLVWWIVPALILLLGIVSIIKPSAIASAPLLIIGWCMMVYGVVEIVNSIKIHQCKKRFKSASQQAKADAASASEEVTGSVESGNEKGEAGDASPM